FFVERKYLMYNDFVIVGPAEDPAGIKGLASAAEALRKIQTAQAAFVSRSDQSGTHKKEQRLWEAAGLSPKG
ncbi:MAG TPA: tungsten ABC transporter substrate-binding protein, partial [candidate division Zixibacteria bacterium]|nr:tungsten ABC transporter substrate-binding protein [candidate division Zixibacteria bacterium]